MSVLSVLPDLYRLNEAQRDQLLHLFEHGLIGTPVRVRKLAGGRVICRDPEGRSWLIHRDGFADLTPTR